MRVGPSKRGKPAKLDTRDLLFLEAYYGEESPTKGKQIESAKAAGFAESTAITKSTRLVKRFGQGRAAESLNAAGVNKPYLAMRLKYVLETGKSPEILSAARLAYTLLGESTDEAKGGTTNTYNAPVMIIAGMSDKRLAALRSALTPEQLEEQENQRCQQKLELLKQGKLPQLPSKTQMKEFERVPQKKVLHQHIADDSGDSEAATPAGGPAGGVESGDDPLS